MRLNAELPRVLGAFLFGACARSVAPGDGGPDAPTIQLDVGGGADAGTMDLVTTDAPTDTALDATVMDATDPLPPPRPIAPLSTATVTSQRPNLSWRLTPGSDGAQVEICRDRACSMIEATINATGSVIAPPSDLRSGVHFWRLRARVGATVGTLVGPTWEFFVGARTAPTNAAWGTVLDVNCDGYRDIVIGTHATGGGPNGASVYLGGSGGIGGTPAITLAAPAGEGRTFGGAIASAGDVNGDGCADLVVGSGGSGSVTGRAFVYLGGAAGIGITPATTLSGVDGDGGTFGSSVSSAGDVNGDGYADLVVGAHRYWPELASRAYVYLGSANGIGATPATILREPDGVNRGIGWSVASAGDVNSDGFGDLVISAGGQNTTLGRAYVYLGGRAGIGMSPTTVLRGPRVEDRDFGCSLAGAGDINGDGYADVVIGQTGRGFVASVFLGGVRGIGTAPAATLAGRYPSFEARWLSVAGAGDVNGDGYADLVMGHASQGTASQLLIFHGGVSGIGPAAATTLQAPGASGEFGRSLTIAGDVNGDGYADLLAGNPGYNHVDIYVGSGGGIGTAPATTLSAPVGTGVRLDGRVANVNVEAEKFSRRRRTTRDACICPPRRAGWGLRRVGGSMLWCAREVLRSDEPGASGRGDHRVGRVGLCA